MLSPTHIVLFLLVVLLALVVFGPKRLPELGSSLGKALQEFKRASTSTMDEVRSVTSVVSSTPTAETKPTEVEPPVASGAASETKPLD
ncbi:MAG TPA: twin-arginine translocase TatA/TatE family subunit [Candidatus Dormibacteraeota bacterium]